MSPRSSVVSPIQTLSAIRLSLIGKPARYIWQPVPHKIERLKIQWNDRGYGNVTVEEEGYLPDGAVSISPDLKEYTAETGRLQARNSGWQISTVGSVQWHASTPFEKIVPPKPSFNGVSIYTRSGQRIGMLPTGRARFVHVLAASHDGRRVVTSTGIKIPESTILWHID